MPHYPAHGSPSTSGAWWRWPTRWSPRSANASPRQRLGRRGTTAERTWTHRQLLLTGYEHLSPSQVARLRATLASEDLTNEIGAAHAVKERLRLLLAESDPPRIRARLFDFYDAAADAGHGRDHPPGQDDPGLVASILTALTDDVTNARTEGFNRIIKHTKRVGCGYRNMEN